MMQDNKVSVEKRMVRECLKNQSIMISLIIEM